MRLAVLETAVHGGLLHYAAKLADALADRGHEVLLTARDNALLERRRSARTRAILARQLGEQRGPDRTALCRA
jgi:hypothetical protein